MMYIFDNHCHANERTGLGAVEIAKRFKRAGGIGIIFVSLTTWSIGGVPGDKNWVVKLYDYTVRNSELARREGLISGAIVGVHPAECAKLAEAGWRLEDIEEFMTWTIDLAYEYVREGRALGLGEYGRPHWRVEEEVLVLCNRVIEYAMGIARDLNAPLHLHLEREGTRTINDVYSLIVKTNAPKYKIVMHHAEGRFAHVAYSKGIMPSVPVGRRGELEEALKHGLTFVVESDFVDDNRRPGAVIPPWTLARKLREMIEEGIMSNDDLRKMADNVGLVYGFNV